MEKGEPLYNTDNTASIIVNTNRNAVRIDTTDRRWVFLDISDEHVGNHEYFDELGECIEEPEVGKPSLPICVKEHELNLIG